MTLLEQLISLREHGPKDPYHGICYNLDKNARAKFLDLAMQWPGWSGSRLYPVPGSRMLSAGAMFNAASAEEMWSPDSDYGASRLRLLDWAIERLSQE